MGAQGAPGCGRVDTERAWCGARAQRLHAQPAAGAAPVARQHRHGRHGPGGCVGAAARGRSPRVCVPARTRPGRCPVRSEELRPVNVGLLRHRPQAERWGWCAARRAPCPPHRQSHPYGHASAKADRVWTGGHTTRALSPFESIRLTLPVHPIHGSGENVSVARSLQDTLPSPMHVPVSTGLGEAWDSCFDSAARLQCSGREPVWASRCGSTLRGH